MIRVHHYPHQGDLVILEPAGRITTGESATLPGTIELSAPMPQRLALAQYIQALHHQVQLAAQLGHSKRSRRRNRQLIKALLSPSHP